jgi:hypothetical protein
MRAISAMRESVLHEEWHIEFDRHNAARHRQRICQVVEAHVHGSTALDRAARGMLRSCEAPIKTQRLGFIKATFDVNKHIEPKHILNVMDKHPGVFADLPPIPQDVRIGKDFVFKP